MKKLEWLGYPTLKKFEDIFIRFDATHERDRQTDRQTTHADIYRAYAYASHGKKHIRRGQLLSMQDIDDQSK